MAHAGVKTRFRLDNASGTLVDLSTKLTSVQGSGDTEFLDATTFQPDVVGSAIKNEIPGFSSKGFSLSGMWDEVVEAHFTAIEGMQGLEYEYKPDDPSVTGSISGTCSCGSYSGPQSDVNGLVTFTAELRVQTRTYNAGSGSFP